MAMTTSKTGYRAGHSRCRPASSSPRSPTRWRDEAAEVERALRGLDHLLATMTAPDRDGGDDPRAGARRGRVLPAPPAFLEGVVERCRAHGILFVADEVQSGFGRTGEMFAVEHFGIEPDVICMAKGIASGFPFAALGTRRELDDQWPTGQSRRHVRRQPDRVRRGAGDDRGADRTGVPRQRPPAWRSAEGRAGRAAAASTTGSARCAASG